MVAARAERGSGRFYYGWVVAGAFALIMGSAWGATQGSFSVFVNPMTDDRGWSRTSIAAAASTLMIVNFAFGVVWGWLSDRWGVRWVVAASGVLMGLGFFLVSTASAVWQLYLFYGFIAAAGLGGTSGPLTAVTSRWFDRKRGLALGVGLAGIGVGTAVLPILSERVVSASNDWRDGFRFLSYVVWGAFLVGALLVREPRRSTVSRAAVASGNPVAGSSSNVGRVSPTPPGQERPGGVAMSLSTALRTRSLWVLFGMMLAATLILQEILLHMVPRAEDVGISSSSAVTLLPVLGIMSTVGKVTGGAWGDRVGPRWVFIGALLLQAAALLWLNAATTMWMFYLFAAAFGLGYGGWTPQLAAIAARAFGPRHMGAIFGVVLLGAGVGGLVGPTMAGFIFDTTGTYRIAFNGSVGIALAAVVLALLVAERPQERRREAPSTHTA